MTDRLNSVTGAGRVELILNFRAEGTVKTSPVRSSWSLKLKPRDVSGTFAVIPNAG
jgi:hypothetical protein